MVNAPTEADFTLVASIYNNYFSCGRATVLLIVVALEFFFLLNFLKFYNLICQFQLTVMEAAKRRKDVTEDSDKEGNFYG